MALLTTAFVLQPQDVSADKHHVLIFENKRVRVFRLTLEPAQATGLHRHSRPYVYFTLEDAQLSNEVAGRTPKVVDVIAGDVHLSKGGFKLAERNAGPKTADIIVIEQLGEAAPYSDPMADFKQHDSAIGLLFEQPGMRAHLTRMAAGGRTEPHAELHDRLIVALTEIQLEDPTEPAGSALNLKPGEAKWIEKGGTHAFNNTGSAAGSFITFEFP